MGSAPLRSEAGLPSLVQALPLQGMRRQFKSGPGLQTLLLGGFGPLFGPACQDCFSGAFASLFGRHVGRPCWPALQPASAAQGHSIRVFSSFDHRLSLYVSAPVCQGIFFADPHFSLDIRERSRIEWAYEKQTPRRWLSPTPGPISTRASRNADPQSPLSACHAGKASPR